MKMIKCRKCGALIDPSGGECPYCGAVYYIIEDNQPDENQAERKNVDLSSDQWIKDNPDEEPTMVWKPTSAGADDDVRVYTPEHRQDAYSGSRQQGSGQPASAQPRVSSDNRYRQTQPDSDPVVSYFSMDDDNTGSSASGPAQSRPQQYVSQQRTAQRSASGQHAYGEQTPRQQGAPRQRTQQYGGPRPQQTPQRTAAAASRQPQQRVSPQEAARRRAQQQAAQEEYRREKKSFVSTYIILAVVVLLALAAVIFCLVNGGFDFNKNEKVYMPSVVGQNVEAAKAVLEDMGLTVKTEDKTSSEAKGIVVEQSIKENAKLSGNETVTLYVSTGSGNGDDDSGEAPSQADDEPSQTTETLKQVPNVKGKTYDAAKQELAALGLQLAKSADEYSDSVAEGLIIAQSPEGSTKLKEGGIVYVTLSKGPEPAPGYTITVTAGKGGKVSPNGLVSVEEGKSQTFTVTPDEGYEVREVKVDGNSIGAVESYTFDNVTSDHTIYAIFQLSEPDPTPTTTPEPTPAPTEQPAETESPSEPEQN